MIDSALCRGCAARMQRCREFRAGQQPAGTDLAATPQPDSHSLTPPDRPPNVDDSELPVRHLQSWRASAQDDERRENVSAIA